MTFVIAILMLNLLQIDQENISDPIEDFVRLNRNFDGISTEIEDVERIQADMNADGIREVLLRNTAVRGNRTGDFWDVYVRRGDTYVRIRSNVIIHPKGVFVGQMEGVTDTQLFAYWRSGGHEGTVMSFKLQGDKIIREIVKTIYPSPGSEPGSDSEFYDKTFGRSREFREMIPSEVVDQIKEEIAAEKAEEEATLIEEPISATTVAENAETPDQPRAAEEVQDAEPLPVSPLAAEDGEPVIEKQAPTETATQESPEGNFTIYLITALGLIIVVGIVAFVRR